MDFNGGGRDSEPRRAEAFSFLFFRYSVSSRIKLYCANGSERYMGTWIHGYLDTADSNAEIKQEVSRTEDGEWLGGIFHVRRLYWG